MKCNLYKHWKLLCCRVLLFLTGQDLIDLVNHGAQIIEIAYVQPLIQELTWYTIWLKSFRRLECWFGFSNLVLAPYLPDERYAGDGALQIRTIFEGVVIFGEIRRGSYDQNRWCSWTNTESEVPCRSFWIPLWR